VRPRESNPPPPLREIVSPIALFVYAITFSLAYVRLTAGTGALVLFGAVQVTMLASAIRAGERPRPIAWLGILVAIGGLVGLTLPGLGAPDPVGTALMAVAGVCWGIYTLRGRNAIDPIGANARSFARSVAPAGVTWILLVGALGGAHADPLGLALAAASGGIASGIGYAVWYTVLPALTATRAAVLQLSVPVITAALAVLLLGESISGRLIFASIAVLGGIAIVVTRPRAPGKIS
jgi:drug/metabolite transporter (DMT)-like permease